MKRRQISRRPANKVALEKAGLWDVASDQAPGLVVNAEAMEIQRAACACLVNIELRNTHTNHLACSISQFGQTALNQLDGCVVRFDNIQNAIGHSAQDQGVADDVRRWTVNDDFVVVTFQNLYGFGKFR